jgi:ferredoxin
MDNRGWSVGSLIPGTMKIQITSNEGFSDPKNIVVQQNKKRFEIQPEKGKLLDVALSQGKSLNFKCRKGTCGLCTVRIIENGKGLSEPNNREKTKLGKELNNGFRLACQAEFLI